MKNYILRILPLVCFCVAAVSCSEDDDHIPYGLSLDVYNHTFTEQGGELTINVQTVYPEWDASFDAGNGWLTETGRTDNSITLSAAPNTGESEKSLVIAFTAGEARREVAVKQATRTAAPSPGFHILESSIMAISRDGGLLVTYDITDDAGTSVLNLYTVNTTSDERKLYLSTSEPITTINAVSDDGRIWAVSLEGAGMSNDRYIVDGEIREAALPSGYVNPQINDLSADGNIMVGTAYDPTTKLTVPIKWTQGSPEILDGPDKSRIGELNIRGNYPVAITGDGGFILGRAFTGNSSEAFFWKGGQWKWLGPEIEKEVEIQMPGGDPVTVPYTFTTTVGPREVGKISPNGKYAAVNFQDFGENMMGMKTIVQVPGLFDIESEEMVAILDDVMELSITGGQGITATDEGGLFYYTDIYAAINPAYHWLDGTVTDTRTLVERMAGYYAGDYLKIRKIVENPLRIIGTFAHPDGVNVPFYIRVTDTDAPTE